MSDDDDRPTVHITASEKDAVRISLDPAAIWLLLHAYLRECPPAELEDAVAHLEAGFVDLGLRRLSLEPPQVP